LSPAINDTLRQVYEGMAHFMDHDIGHFVDALKATNKWEQTLVIFSSDNGGREDADFGGNNYPLRGMKFTDFEGGTRVTAFASGGVLPQNVRGSTVTNLMHICDWFATFSFLAGVDPVDHKAIANHVPATDSVNLWPTLATPGGTNARTEITLSKNAIILWPYKLVLGSQGGKGWWSSPFHPNATQKDLKDNDKGCPADGCLFNIEEDPSEYVDLSVSLPSMKANLTAALAASMATAYQTNESPGYNNCVTDKVYAAAHQNFLGPVCQKGTKE
jgi:arylsulfatase A-like enzyme